MKKLFPIFLLILSFGGHAQPTKFYNPEADVAASISQGLTQAKTENKQLLLQIGGNWCPWCTKFHKLCSSDQDIRTLMNKNYISITVNYSKENRNLATLKRLEYPQRFGFPVFVILDKDGKRIHTQSSAFLEEGDSYSKKRVIEFLRLWTTDALNPDLYTDK